MKSLRDATPRSAAPLGVCSARLPLSARYLGMPQQERETLATETLATRGSQRLPQRADLASPVL